MTKLDLAHLAEVAGKLEWMRTSGAEEWETATQARQVELQHMDRDLRHQFRRALTPEVALALLDRLREAEGTLRSISKNTCCDQCQEAARWAASYFTPQPPSLPGRGEE